MTAMTACGPCPGTFLHYSHGTQGVRCTNEVVVQTVISGSNKHKALAPHRKLKRYTANIVPCWYLYGTATSQGHVAND